MTLTTSRKCPQCGSEVSSTARFCPECGSAMTPAGAAPGSGKPGLGPSGRPIPPFAGIPPTGPAVRAAPHADNTQRTIVGILIGAVVLLSIMVAVLAATLRHTNLAAAQPCVSAPTPAPAAPAGAGEAHLPSAASISPSPSETAGASPAATTTTAPTTAPADIVDYLKFLQGIDQRRIALLTAASSTPQASQSGTATTPPTAGSNQAADWQSLTSDFQNHSVPDAFSTFAGEYMTFLVDCQSAAGKPADQLGSITTEANKLDGDLARLCTNQKVVKPFTIAAPPAQPAPQPSSATPTPPSTPPSQP